MLSIYDVIKKPLITERSTQDSESLGKYHFIVDTKATKDDIKKAVEMLFNVQVKSVNTMNNHGKPKRVKNYFSHRQSTKKAIVTLKGESKIDFFDETQPETVKE